jgi:hypothetical protein
MHYTVLSMVFKKVNGSLHQLTLHQFVILILTHKYVNRQESGYTDALV